MNESIAKAGKMKKKAFLTEITEHTERGEAEQDMACKFLRLCKNLQAIFSVNSSESCERVREI